MMIYYVDDVPDDKSGYVYFIRDCLGHIKIGVSKNVKKRMAGLQTANPLKLEYFYVMKVKNIYDARLIEKELHEQFKDFRLCGEWFLEQEILKFLKQEHIYVTHYVFKGATWQERLI